MLLDGVRAWWAGPHEDAVTGDRLSALEYLTLLVQTGLRSPWFLLGFNVVTIVALAVGGREGWNYFASWLAIIVEWIVGTFMLGQTHRDARCLREVRALAERLAKMEATELDKLDALTPTRRRGQRNETRR